MQLASSKMIMLTVAACLLPGLIVEALLVSVPGVLLNMGAALITAFVTERLCLLMRGRRPPLAETDPSALVTALILAAALPPGATAAVACATLVALALGKHAYGGLGNNVFNPAMVGYAVVLVSFPAGLADWPVPLFAGTERIDADALTGATALTAFKYRGAATVDGIWTQANGFGLLGSYGYEWVSVAFFLGGCLLFILRLAAWRPCAGMLVALAALSLASYDNGSSASLGSPSYHLFSGGTLLAACFVATDPVTHPSGYRDQWLFGLILGGITFCVRSWGNYPDGIVFAVLLGNALTPFLDRRLLQTSGTSHG